MTADEVREMLVSPKVPTPEMGWDTYDDAWKDGWESAVDTVLSHLEQVGHTVDWETVTEEERKSAVQDAFIEGYGSFDCICHEAYRNRGRHEPNAEGCPAEVAYFLGLSRDMPRRPGAQGAAAPPSRGVVEGAAMTPAEELRKVLERTLKPYVVSNGAMSHLTDVVLAALQAHFAREEVQRRCAEVMDLGPNVTRDCLAALGLLEEER